MRPTATMGAPGAAVVTGAAVQSIDQAVFTSVATSNANMSSGAMVTGATALTTAIIRTGAIIRSGAINSRRADSRGAMAVSGTGGRRMATDTNRPPMDMRSRRGRQRRFGTGPAMKPFLTRRPIRMPANPGHTIRHCRRPLLHLEPQMCRNRSRGPLAMLASGLPGSLHLGTL
jgi:hypothetical protein